MEYLCLSTGSLMEFYRQLCSILGVDGKGGTPGMFHAMQEQIRYLYQKRNIPFF